MRRFLFALAGLTAILGLASAQTSGPAIPREYFITPPVGPWAICTASFTGDVSAKMAENLVTELRGQYRLRAYLYNRSAEQRHEQEEEIRQKRQLQEQYLRNAGLNPTDVHLTVRKSRIEDQYVVLIGGYADMEAARRDLNKIKKLQAPRSVPKDVIVQGPLDGPPKAGQKPEQKEFVNPFASSFVVRNPTVPAAKETANRADPALKEWNADESFSLLKCPKPWTMVVKEFHGGTVLQSQSAPTGLMDKLFGSKSGERLNACKINAHNLAEAIHKKGFETYVLHTRTGSIVTVGGFDSATDPRMAQLHRDLTSKFEVKSSDPRFSAAVGLFPQPRPREVPRP